MTLSGTSDSHQKQQGIPARRFPESRKAIPQFVRRNPIVLVGIGIVIAWVLLALLAPIIAPQDPLAQNVSNRLQAPSQYAYMGTDELGRDVLSRVLYGGRITIPAALIVVMLAGLIGTLFGTLAGYSGGIWDEGLMRLTDLFLAFPVIILAMAIAAALGPATRNAIIALIIVRWPHYSRLMRGLVLEVKNQEYVVASRSMGASHIHILVRTLLPNTIAIALVYASLDIGTVILLFAALGFLGLGADPSSPEWGRMVSIGVDFFDQWWMWLFPGLAIATFVMAVSFLGDGLRDALDPRSQQQ